MTSLIMGYSGFGQNLKNKIRNSSFSEKMRKIQKLQNLKEMRNTRFVNPWDIRNV